MKKLLSRYNALATPSDRVLSWAEAINLSTVSEQSSTSGIPRNIRLSAVRHHHLALRADEEVHIIKCEMKSSFSFFLDDWKCL